MEMIQTRGVEVDCYAQIFKGVKLKKQDLILPIFVSEKSDKSPLEMDPIYGLTKILMKDLCLHVQRIIEQGISSVILFGVPEKRDISGSSALKKEGVVQMSTKKIKREFGGQVKIITDVCICQYNLSGHCGLAKSRKGSGGFIDNDSTLTLLSKIAASHAEAGADIVAPSSMMDGQVNHIRSALDNNGFKNTKIMAYSAKHASSLYSPFRMTTFSKRINSYTNIDKSSYQIGYANPRQVIREIEADIQEGADMIMIKPSLAYLDVVAMVHEGSDFPLVVQSVSGEYAMIKSAARKGWIEEEEWKVNSIAAMKRAGAHNIISYFSLDITKYLDG
jgi:porphobilinogen synthase